MPETHAVAEHGKLEEQSVAELLERLAVAQNSAELVVTTGLGNGRVWFREGRLVDAEMGELAGEAAVARLLEVKEGEYLVEYKSVTGLPAINESVPALLGRRKRRAAEWQRLVREMPALDTALLLAPEELHALEDADFELVRLVDGRRTIIEIVEESGLDPIAVLERLAWYLKAGVLRSPSERPKRRAGGTLIGGVEPATEPLATEPPVAEHASIMPAPIIRLSPNAAAPGSTALNPRTTRTLVGFAPPAAEPAPAPSSAAPPVTVDGSEQPDSSPPDSREERPSEAPVLPVRALLGRYEVLCRIARGGMGSVYLCRVTGQGGFRRLFALKALRRRLTRNSAATRMFLQEARIAAKIYDPHVVGIVDVGIHGAQPYLVMDYVEGGSLQQLLSRHPRHRPARLIVPLLLDALAGLHAAHTLTDDDGAALELVHCDVSPHNMLVGVDGTCRLSDFGIAKAAAAAGSRGVIGSHGKPGYLSPEQAAGQSFDHRADLFSLGVVMWNALTGERLFSARTIDEALENVLYKEILPPSSVGLKPPACLDAICLKALSRDPAARYQSADEMLRALRAVAIREDLLAPSSDVARWVVETFGEELQARRLAVVDASRRAKAAGSTATEVLEADRASHTELPSVEEPLPSADDPLPSGPVSSGPISAADSPTVVLPRNERKNRVVLGAAVVSLLVVISALAFPNQLAKLFRVETAQPSPRPSSFEPKLPSLQAPVRAREAQPSPEPAEAKPSPESGAL